MMVDRGMLWLDQLNVGIIEIYDSNTIQLSWKSTNNMISKVIFGHQHDFLSETQTCEVRSVALQKQPYTLHNQLKHLQQRGEKKKVVLELKDVNNYFLNLALDGCADFILK